jgi:coenzyme F420 hydrogenase subunit beta
LLSNPQTVQAINNQGLCAMCGTCAGICPTSAITLRYNEKSGGYSPVFNSSLCIHCGLCLTVCPGIGINAKEMNEQNDNGDNNFEAVQRFGRYIGCYIGHATSPTIRRNATSGGAATALLTFLLEKNLIDGAVVTRTQKDNPLEPESFIARTSEELLTASTTKYCPTKPNECLKQILQKKGRYAVIGLPCHIQGIRKAEQIKKELNERIVLHLGLFCQGRPSFLPLYNQLSRMKLHLNEIQRLTYRIGWPTNFVVELKNGLTITQPIKETLLMKAWNLKFIPRRCLLCYDSLNELADISFGDAWIKRNDNESTFRSLIITRNKYADKILKEASALITIKDVSVSQVAQSQAGSLNFKGKVQTRLKLL